MITNVWLCIFQKLNWKLKILYPERGKTSSLRTIGINLFELVIPVCKTPSESLFVNQMKTFWKSSGKSKVSFERKCSSLNVNKYRITSCWANFVEKLFQRWIPSSLFSIFGIAQAGQIWNTAIILDYCYYRKLC